MAMEHLLNGGMLHAEIDEQLVFSQLDGSESAVWSLLLASGYLKAVHVEEVSRRGKTSCDLVITNEEVRQMFEGMIEDC